MKKFNKIITALCFSTSILSLSAATDGTLDSSESLGNVLVELNIAPEILVTRLDDLIFSDISSASSLSDTYSETVQTDFCVYTNAPEFLLSVEPLNDELQNQDWGIETATSSKVSIPVTYSIIRNDISAGAVTGTTTLNTFTTDAGTPPQGVLLDIMNTTCTSAISGNPLDNYTLTATVTGSDIKKAASGYYNELVFIRASVFGVIPE